MIDSRFPCPNRKRNAKCQTELFDPHCIHCGGSVLERSDEVVIHVMNDIFKGQPNECIIVQQVNCKGVMGAGLAKAILNHYPMVYEHYRAEYELGLLELGYTSYIEVEPNKFVANICGQDGYGKGRRFTDYDALRAGLEDVKMMAEALNVDVVIPYKIGSGLAGGDWEGVVSPMVDEVFKGNLIAFVFQGGEEHEENQAGQNNRRNGLGLISSNGEEEVLDF
jgi:O-acetyl-ADP-ribose deacetylase (regulator of RNase III)